jgi:hypothetical protein
VTTVVWGFAVRALVNAGWGREVAADGFFNLRDVGSGSGPLVKGEVFVCADQAQALASGNLEVQVRVWHLELCHEPGLEDPAPCFFHVIGLDLQPDRSGAAQELALVGHAPVAERDVEVLTQPDEIPFGIRLRDFTAENLTVDRWMRSRSRRGTRTGE